MSIVEAGLAVRSSRSRSSDTERAVSRDQYRTSRKSRTVRTARTARTTRMARKQDSPHDHGIRCFVQEHAHPTFPPDHPTTVVTGSYSHLARASRWAPRLRWRGKAPYRPTKENIDVREQLHGALEENFAHAQDTSVAGSCLCDRWCGGRGDTGLVALAIATSLDVQAQEAAVQKAPAPPVSANQGED